MLWRRRSLLATPVLLGSCQREGPLRYGTRPPLTIPNVKGNISPLGWKIGFFDDFTSFVASRTSETARTDATTLWETTLAPGTHHVNEAKEQQYYCNPFWTPGINPFRQSGSILSIIASVATPAEIELLRGLEDYRENGFAAPYISGALNTSLIFSKGIYCGYFELNCKLPPGAGMWTAFWLNYRPEPYSPEFDIMEQIGSRPTRTTGSLHFEPDKNTEVVVANVDVRTDLTRNFHTYGGLWTPNYAACYFDGRLIGISSAGIGTGIGYFNPGNPMDVRINFAIGTGMDDPPARNDEFPVEFQIDWFRYSVLGPE